MHYLKNERHIHRLLLQREREFTAVWRVECEVNKILGADFPFADPPELPSSKKVRKKKSQARKKTARLPKVNALIRNLQDPENAYKITYSCGSDIFESVHTDTSLLRQLLPLQTDSFKIIKIETLRLQLDIESEVVEELWNETIAFQA